MPDRTTTRPTPRRGRLRAVGAAWCAAALVLLAPADAGAHVTTEADSTTTGQVEADGRTTVVFSFDHGCDGAATTGLRVRLPAEATDVSGDPSGDFTATVADGVLSWAGGSVPDSQPATFTSHMRLSGQAGQVLVFPTNQVCGDTDTLWADLPTDADPDPAYPAPTLTLTEAMVATAAVPTGDTPGAGSTALPTTSVAPLPVLPPDPPKSTSGQLVFWGTLGVIAVAGLVLYLKYRPDRDPD